VDAPQSGYDQARAAEVIAALSLATDLGMGLPLEHGLHSTLVAMRLCERLSVDAETAMQTYYGCLLFYIGCTADAEIHAELFDEGALLVHFTPVMFGSRMQTVGGIMRKLAASPGALPTRATRAAVRLPRAVGGHRSHVAALCEVAQMLTDRLGLPRSVRDLFLHLTERWDGKGEPGRLKGADIPLSLRIVHVARDAAFQRLLGGDEYAAQVVRDRAGNAFDPEVATLLVTDAEQILGLDPDASVWDETLANEPGEALRLSGERIQQALAAIGEFTDLLSPHLVGHSNGVADLAEGAAQRCRMGAADVTAVRRAALVHDVGRVAIPARIWQKATPLTTDEWEQVRLHAYYTERVLRRSPFLAALVPIAMSHHERLDGSGYHRGVDAPALAPTARLLAAADAYHAMIEPRPYREARTPGTGVRGVGPRGQGRTSRRRQCRRGPGGRRPRRPATDPASRPLRARGSGRRAAGARPADQTDRPRARHLRQDRGPACAEGIRQNRCLDPSRRRPLRHAARARRMGRTPNRGGHEPLVASKMKHPAHRPGARRGGEDERHSQPGEA
jgi:HD-GYP domain-containing protein (c-di-GMP phosphodiesterase class II)